MNISDSELRERLIARGFKPPPINDNSRKLLIAKLQKLETTELPAENLDSNDANREVKTTSQSRRGRRNCERSPTNISSKTTSQTRRGKRNRLPSPVNVGSSSTISDSELWERLIANGYKPTITDSNREQLILELQKLEASAPLAKKSSFRNETDYEVETTLQIKPNEQKREPNPVEVDSSPMNISDSELRERLIARGYNPLIIDFSRSKLIAMLKKLESSALPAKDTSFSADADIAVETVSETKRRTRNSEPSPCKVGISPITNISDSELRERLIARGYHPPLISNFSRPLLIKKLQKLESSESSAEDPSSAMDTDTDAESTPETNRSKRNNETTPIISPVTNISDSELRERLIARGYQPPPIADYSRELLIKKLQKLEASTMPAKNPSSVKDTDQEAKIPSPTRPCKRQLNRPRRIQ